jgi:hypothetical protein
MTPPSAPSTNATRMSVSTSAGRSRLLAFLEQQRGDQESAEDEEDVDAVVAAGEPGRRVNEEHEDDGAGAGAHPIQCRTPAKPVLIIRGSHLLVPKARRKWRAISPEVFRGVESGAITMDVAARSLMRTEVQVRAERQC